MKPLEIVFTNNHYDTVHEALAAANIFLAANSLPLFTYGACGGGSTGNPEPKKGNTHENNY